MKRLLCIFLGHEFCRRYYFRGVAYCIRCKRYVLFEQTSEAIAQISAVESRVRWDRDHAS